MRGSTSIESKAYFTINRVNVKFNILELRHALITNQIWRLGFQQGFGKGEVDYP